MVERHHRLRVAIGVLCLLIGPVWFVVALATGSSPLWPALLVVQSAYYLVKGYREGLHRVQADMLPHKLRMQEKLTQECVRRGGGYFWPMNDDAKKVEAEGFPTGAVTRL